MRLTKELVEKLAGWLAQLVTVQEMIRMPILEKILSNTDASKRFTWVPKKFRKDPAGWFSSPNCKLDKDVKIAIEKAIKAPSDKKEEAILALAKKFIEIESDKRKNGSFKLKENDPDFLDDMFDGFAAMSKNLSSSMTVVLKNTNNDKIAEVIANDIVDSRNKHNKTAKKESKEKVKNDDEESDNSSSRAKNKKKVKTLA